MDNIEHQQPPAERPSAFSPNSPLGEIARRQNDGINSDSVETSPSTTQSTATHTALSDQPQTPAPHNPLVQSGQTFNFQSSNESNLTTWIGLFLSVFIIGLIIFAIILYRQTDGVLPFDSEATPTEVSVDQGDTTIIIPSDTQTLSEENLGNIRTTYEFATEKEPLQIKNFENLQRVIFDESFISSVTETQVAYDISYNLTDKQTNEIEELKNLGRFQIGRGRMINAQIIVDPTTARLDMLYRKSGFFNPLNEKRTLLSFYQNQINTTAAQDFSSWLEAQIRDFLFPVNITALQSGRSQTLEVDMGNETIFRINFSLNIVTEL